MVLLIFILVVVSDALSDALRRSWLAGVPTRRGTARAVQTRLAVGVRGLAA